MKFESCFEKFEFFARPYGTGVNERHGWMGRGRLMPAVPCTVVMGFSPNPPQGVKEKNPPPAPGIRAILSGCSPAEVSRPRNALVAVRPVDPPAGEKRPCPKALRTEI